MSFLDDYKTLQLKTPRVGMIHLKQTNSDFCYNIDECKNCYLIANAVKNEDCMYGRDFYGNTDCVDCDHILNCTLCCETINCHYCYNCSHLQDSENCHDCEYGYDLKGCRNCFGCASLRNKEYYIYNTSYHPDEYKKKLEEIKKNAKESTEEIGKHFEETKFKTPRVYAVQTNSENFFGNYINHSQNAYEAFDVLECQDVGYIAEAKYIKDSYDIFVLEHGELCYNISSAHIMHNCNCCFFSTSCSDCEYSELLFNCDYCFGCIALHLKKYHILNKPYKKEEYFKEVAKIKEELRSQGLYGELIIPPSYVLEDTVGSWRVM